jgi:hypothetical protein
VTNTKPTHLLFIKRGECSGDWIFESVALQNKILDMGIQISTNFISDGYHVYITNPADLLQLKMLFPNIVIAREL